MTNQIIQDYENIEDKRTKSKRLERIQMKEEIFKAYDDLNCDYIRNYAPCGIGKTHLSVDLIKEHPEESFSIIIPDHKMAQGSGDLEEMLKANRIDYIHIFGKTQIGHRGKYCLRTEGEEYYPGCGIDFDSRKDLLDFSEKYRESYRYNDNKLKCSCAYRSQCEYKKQMKESETKQVIICVLEHTSLFDNKVMIFDESFEQKLISYQDINEGELKKYNLSLSSEDFVDFGNRILKFYKINRTNNIKISSQRDYFVNRFFEGNDNIQCYKVSRGDNVIYKMFGFKTNYIPPNYRKIIFNCATTPDNIMRIITNTEFLEGLNPEDGGWFIYKSKIFNVRNLENPIMKSSYNWNKRMAIGYMKDVAKYLNCITKNGLMITKKDIETEVMQILDQWDFVHYNSGRGFNSLKDKGFDLIVMYGRFGFDPITKEIWKRLGFRNSEIDSIETSEMLQCLHRGRPLLNPDIPIMLMTDKDLFQSYNKFSFKILEMYYKNLGINYKISYKDLSIRLKEKSNCVLKQFVDFCEFIKDI
jgi:hypothetical protein